jgi:cell migration-inducing and hyaluronan-binding protein
MQRSASLGIALAAVLNTMASPAAQAAAWSAIAWPNGVAPTAAPCVRVQAGAVVDFDASAPVQIDGLLVEGEFRFAGGADRELQANMIVVDGIFTVGTAATPLLDEARIVMADGTACTTSYEIDAAGVATEVAAVDLALYHPAGEINRTLLVRGAATVEMHGAPRASTWKLLLDGAVNPGDTTLTVFRGDDWQVGDQVVLASTDFNMLQAEVLTITGISPHFPAAPWLPFEDLTVDPPLAHTHWSGRVGASVAGSPDVYEDAEIGLLTHNIKVYPSYVPPIPVTCWEVGRSLIATGVEIRILSEPNENPPAIRLQHVEIYNAGKHGLMGHYPIHFHELGDVSDSYVKGCSVRRSSNRGIVVHGTQRLVVENNVVYDVAGHAYYLEPSQMYDTRENLFRYNLALVASACNPLDIIEDKPDQPLFAAGFYFEDPRNSFIGNAAAGAAHSGFYFAARTQLADTAGQSMDQGHLCGDAAVDYLNAQSYVLLDTTDLDYTVSSYPDTEYGLMGFEEIDGVHCHGAFRYNIAHSSTFGFWADEHKDTLIRLYDFIAYKHSSRAVAVKNKGITEVLGLRAADNKTAVWPASHGYHLWYTPRFLLLDSHLVGESANLGTPVTADELAAGRSLPGGTWLGTPIYGIETYEGQMHVARTHFELFEPFCPGLGDRWIAAFGRHQTFPFYSNNPNNSVQELSFDAVSRRAFFEDPAPLASGEASVMLYDVDGSLTTFADNWVVPNHDFIVPGASALGAPVCADKTSRNINHVQGPAEMYGQLIVHWCDSGPDINCSDNGRADFPSAGWTHRLDRLGVVDRLEIEDLTDNDVFEAKHAPDGTHLQLGGNVLSGRQYEVRFQLDPTKSFSDITAMEIHFRDAPAGAAIDVSIEVPGAPDAAAGVWLYRGEDPSQIPTPMTENPISPPASPLEWHYDGVRVHLYLDAAAQYENAAVLLFF